VIHDDADIAFIIRTPQHSTRVSYVTVGNFFGARSIPTTSNMPTGRMTVVYRMALSGRANMHRQPTFTGLLPSMRHVHAHAIGLLAELITL
jgi:hypothetical protein